MKNVTVTFKDKNGEETKVSAEVEDEIAAWLSEKDEDFVREFIAWQLFTQSSNTRIYGLPF